MYYVPLYLACHYFPNLMPLVKLTILVFSKRRNFDDDKKYTYTCLHWHHDMVMDLAFSVMGK